MAACLALLAGSEDAPGDRLAFQLAQLGFWLLAAGDGHAKNYSIFLRQGSRYGMTPLYDITHYRFHTIHARHWHAQAMKNGGAAVWEAMLGLVERVEPALAAVEAQLPGDFPPRIWEAIARGMRSQVERFRMGLAEVR
jgi:serine/threonine-protein kinase HipA